MFNVVGSGVLPVSVLFRLAGRRTIPLPAPLLDRLSYHPSQGQTGDPPAAFFDYLRNFAVNPFEGFGAVQYGVAGGSMLVSVIAYATKAPWKLAIGVVVITFVHELGHALGLLKHSPYADDIMNDIPTVTTPSPEDRRTIEVLYHTRATIIPPPP